MTLISFLLDKIYMDYIYLTIKIVITEKQNY